MRRWRAGTVWLALGAADGFLNRLLGTVFNVFLILRVGLDPLQLVLMGTVLEVSYLLFEVPTGVLADVRSRKASIVVGYLGTGLAFLVLGAAESFAVAALSQVLYGISATFVSGADVAWLTDEIGEEAARPMYLRGERSYNLGSLVGMVGSVALASVALPLPIVATGLGYLGLGLALTLVMVETPRPSRGRGSTLRASVATTVREAIRQVRAHHVLLLILATAALHGASTEGWDRLADLHFLRGIGLPSLYDLDRVVWFAVFDGVSLLLGLGAITFIERRVHLEGHTRVATLLAGIDGLMIAGTIAFAVVGSFWGAVVAFWIVGGLRSVRDPIFTAWNNQGLDPATRATVNSIGGQSDAVGQALAGPVVGGVGRTVSVPWAISVAGLLRVPALLLYVRAVRRGSVGTKPPEAIEQELTLDEGEGA
ncbi:MAG TPA: MFS transporter [Actinomycetota bacterium]|nr:MFS transporter [Actinomycetota bacterium]